MATRNRPIALTAAALASAATVVAATPDLMSSRDLSIASAPSPNRLSSASYELTAFSDITIAGLNDAYWFGWGGYVGCGAVNDQGQCTNVPKDVYYPELSNLYVDGASGALYYLIDNIIDQFTDDFDLDNYYFEVGSQNFGFPNARYSGAGALLYVGIGQTFGTDSQIFQTAKTIFYYGITPVINQMIVSLASLVPEIQLGPITIGGGTLATLYYYGVTPDQTFQANSIGLPAIWAYFSTALTGLVPTAAAVTPEAAAATSLAAAAATVADEIAPAAKAVAGLKTEAATPAAETTTDSAATGETTAAATTETTTTEAATTEAATTEAATTEAATAPDTTAAAEAAPAAGSGTSTSTSSESSTSTDTPSTDTPSTDTTSDSSASTGGSAAGKVTKPKAQNPIGKITGKIKSALGGDTGGKHRADGSGKSSSSAGASSSSSSSSSDSGSDSGSDK